MTVLISKLKNEFLDVYTIIERYEPNATMWDSSFNMKILIKDYKITVNFEYVVETKSLLYLFDRGKTLFAVVNKETKTTHLQNIKTFKKLICELEDDCDDKTLPGDITVLPQKFSQTI
jgi:hypothetical protein